jgi:hypothetical protein
MNDPIHIAPGARAWIAVISHAHVERGKGGGFTQVCHGKRAPLERMKPGSRTTPRPLNSAAANPCAPSLPSPAC